MKPNEYKYDIFVSFNKKDREWARHLAESLKRKRYRKSNFRVFFDEWSIKSGESIPAAIRNGLKSSEHVLLVMSQDWVESEWCLLEADTTIFSDPAAKRRKIIPILLRDCKIPEDIARLKRLDFRNRALFEQNLKLLIKDLRGDPCSIKLAKLITKQRRTTLNEPILPWSPEKSPSLDFLWPDLFIDPIVQLHKHPRKPLRFKDWLQNYEWTSNIAIVGPPGIGKSTILRSIFLKLTDYIDRPGKPTSNKTPILTNAAEVLEYRNSSADSLPDYVATSYGISLSRRLVSRNKFLFLIDGLDEVSESDISQVLDSLQQSIPDDAAIWTACRSDIFFQKIANKKYWSSAFYEILELLEWDEKTDSLEFASNYAQRTKQPHVYDKLIELKSKYLEIVPFLRNPFELTLLLYILTDDKPIERYTILNPYALYSSFYQNWVSREHHRGTANLPSSVVYNAHRILAAELYKAKGRGVELRRILTKHGLEEKVFQELIQDTSFSALLITRVGPGFSSIKTLRFWHETIGEFFVAESVLEAFIKGGEGLYDALKTVYNYEINSFVRGGFECLQSEEIAQVFNNLSQLYSELFFLNRKRSTKQIPEGMINQQVVDLKDVNDSPDATRIREQILYYIGRMPLTKFPNILNFSFYNEPLPLLRRIAALGAILHGDTDIEISYLNSLTHGSDEDILNRSVQLVYFGDVDGDIHTFRDNNKYDWTRTRNEIYQRLKLSSKREMCLRFWDLRTLRLFYESRGCAEPVTKEELETICNTKIGSSKCTQQKKQLLEKEKSFLLDNLQSKVLRKSK